jgi:hypothetical protein
MDLRNTSEKIPITISTANNGITPILNTTTGIKNPSSTGVGARRGAYAGKWLYIPNYLFTAQNVTLTFQTLANGAWVSDLDVNVPSGFVGGGNTITANASIQDGFVHFIAGEVNVFITNGGTGPTIAAFDAFITDQFPGNWG